KDFSGQSLDVYFGTSTEGGADEQRLNFLDGRTFNDGRTSITTSFSFQHREPLTLGERDYLERAFERFGPDSGVITRQGRPAFEQYMLPALAGVPGVIVLNSATGDLGIPGR